jgi:hypothetical protein
VQALRCVEYADGEADGRVLELSKASHGRLKRTLFVRSNRSAAGTLTGNLSGAERCPLFAANELAIARHAVETIRVDKVTAGTTGDPVGAGPSEEPISASAADENVMAGAAVEQVGAAEAAKQVRPRRPAQDLAA